VVPVRSVYALKDNIQGMQRVVVPGETEVRLTAGEHVVYAESNSVVDGTAYHTESFSLRCAVVDADTGEAASLSTPTGSTTYSMFGFSGEAVFDLDVPDDGTYRVVCEGDDPPAVIAIGDGMGWGIAMIAISGLFAVFGTIAVLAVVATLRFKRRAMVPS
jgi:hypothetical protein